MANQLNIQASLTVQGGPLSLQGIGLQTPSQASTSAKSVFVIRSPSSSVAVLTTTDITTTAAYWIFIKNIDTTNTLTVLTGTNSAGTGAQAFSTLKAGDFCLVCIPATQFVFVTGSGSNNVQVVGVEP